MTDGRRVSDRVSGSRRLSRVTVLGTVLGPNQRDGHLQERSRAVSAERTDERDGSFGSRWLLITGGLRNVAPLAERTRRIPSRAERARSRSDTVQVSPRDQSSHHWHCFIDLACAGDGGLRRLRSALPHTRAALRPSRLL